MQHFTSQFSLNIFGTEQGYLRNKRERPTPDTCSSEPLNISRLPYCILNSIVIPGLVMLNEKF